jgi:hypothetical protein
MTFAGHSTTLGLLLHKKAKLTNTRKSRSRKTFCTFSTVYFSPFSGEAANGSKDQNSVTWGFETVKDDFDKQTNSCNAWPVQRLSDFARSLDAKASRRWGWWLVAIYSQRNKQQDCPTYLASESAFERQYVALTPIFWSMRRKKHRDHVLFLEREKPRMGRSMGWSEKFETEGRSMFQRQHAF